MNFIKKGCLSLRDIPELSNKELQECSRLILKITVTQKLGNDPVMIKKA